MHQFLLGAAPFFLGGVALYLWRRGRASLTMLTTVPALMAAGGVWAVVPDLPRLVGWHSLYQRMASDPRTDLFFWHYSIDRVETDCTHYQVLGVLMGVGLVVAAWRELRRAEEGG